MEIIETQLADYLGLKREHLRKLRKVSPVPVVCTKPIKYDEKGALEIIQQAVNPADVEAVLRSFLDRLQKKEARRGVVMRKQWRNPRILRVQLVPEGTTVRVLVKKNRDFIPGREVEVIPGSGEMWEINPKWGLKKKRRAARRRRAG